MTKHPGHCQCACVYAPPGERLPHGPQFEILFEGQWHTLYPTGGCSWYWAQGHLLPVRWRQSGHVTREWWP